MMRNRPDFSEVEKSVGRSPGAVRYRRMAMVHLLRDEHGAKVVLTPLFYPRHIGLGGLRMLIQNTLRFFHDCDRGNSARFGFCELVRMFAITAPLAFRLA